jgi:ribosomal protein S18 acetylase RimI-like enzyme
MDLKFKRASKDDAKLIAQLADNIWRKHYISIITMEQIEYMLNQMYSVESLSQQMNEGHQFTLVYNGETPVGYISLNSTDGKNYFLHKFYIEVADQGKGIGSELLAYILGQMPNAETIQLFVNRENFKTVNFYFKHGFVIKEIINQDIGEGFFMNDFVMIKKIK